MSLWLDHLVFGNGRGMKSPYWDSKFYWLSGRLYTWIGGLGAQLQSTQWAHAIPGEERKLDGRTYYPFHSTRQGLRVRVSWATRLPEDVVAANVMLREIKQSLDQL